MNNIPIYPGWETVQIIGAGSYGEVYEIERDVFGKKEKSALKVLSVPRDMGEIEALLADGYTRSEIEEHFNSVLSDIVREYQIMADLRGCSNIVDCDDILYSRKSSGIGWDIYIKMELLEPLTDVLSEQLDEEQVVRVGTDICKALLLCEKRNIIHRDIKPQNIFVSRDGNYKLGDFGIAKTVEKTSGGTLIGTYNYMAPEVYNNEPYGRAADIYSLGMTLYWLLNEKRMPFLPLPPAVPTMREKEAALHRRFRGDTLPYPANGDVALKKIILKACAFEQKERYRTAEEFLADLMGLKRIGSTAVLVRADTGELFQISKERTTIGRYSSHMDDQADIALRGTKTISRRHAEIVSSMGQFYLADVGSKHGSFYNDERIPTFHKVLLEDNSKITLAREHFLVFIGDNAFARAAKASETIIENKDEEEQLKAGSSEDVTIKKGGLPADVSVENATVKRSAKSALLLRLQGAEAYVIDRDHTVLCDGCSVKRPGAVLNDTRVKGGGSIAIYCREEKFVIHNSGNRPEVMVNGTEIENTKDYEIADADMIEFGREKFLFLCRQNVKSWIAAGKIFTLESVRTGEIRALDEKGISLDRNHPWKAGVLSDPTVSRNHAVIVWKSGEFSIRDVGSVNGTFINDKEILEMCRDKKNNEVPLYNGDRIGVAGEAFRFSEFRMMSLN